MYHMKYLLIFTLLFLLSCTKDSAPISSDNSKDFSFDYLDDAEKEDRTSQIISYLEPSLKTNYKEDFLIANIPDDLLNAKPNNLEVSLLRIGGTRNKVEMQEQYGMVKAQLQQWLTDNSNKQYSSTIQYVSLRYLRLVFLEENSVVSNQEIEFLLETLIDLRAEDLDVLADAYHKIKPNLNDSKRKNWFNYLKTVYDKNFKLINDKALEYKEAYENAKDNPTDRFKYLMYGKDLERRSKSCFHANDLLKFNAQD